MPHQDSHCGQNEPGRRFIRHSPNRMQRRVARLQSAKLKLCPNIPASSAAPCRIKIRTVGRMSPAGGLSATRRIACNAVSRVSNRQSSNSVLTSRSMRRSSTAPAAARTSSDGSFSNMPASACAFHCSAARHSPTFYVTWWTITAPRPAASMAITCSVAT